VSDDIYDYFSGNATRKVEPIEDDDDDDVTEQESALSNNDSDSDSAPEENGDAPAVAEEPTPAVTDAVASASQTSVTASVEPEVPEAVEEKESGGHWDFLAGFLGIGGSKSKGAAEKATTEKPAEPVKAEAESAAPRAAEPTNEVTAKSTAEGESPKPDDSKPAIAESTEEDDLFAAFEGFGSPAKTDAKQEQKRKPPVSRAEPEPTKARSTNDKGSQGSDFFGLDDVPSPEDDTPLKTMFGDSPSPSASTASTADEGESESGDNGDFIEFEVRDLVDPDDQDSDRSWQKIFGSTTSCNRGFNRRLFRSFRWL
jgi:hypothetical protein